MSRTDLISSLLAATTSAEMAAVEAAFVEAREPIPTYTASPRGGGRWRVELGEPPVTEARAPKAPSAPAGKLPTDTGRRSPAPRPRFRVRV